MKKPFHLAWFLSQGYGPKIVAERLARQRHRSLDDARSVSRSGRGLERACFDYMIIEDSSMVPYTYQGSHDTYLQYAASDAQARSRPCWCRISRRRPSISGWSRRCR